MVTQRAAFRVILQAVRNTALRRLMYAAARYTVFTDPGNLDIAEQMIARGVPTQDLVRLPELVAWQRPVLTCVLRVTYPTYPAQQLGRRE
jgi:hypothetical protein